MDSKHNAVLPCHRYYICVCTAREYLLAHTRIVFTMLVLYRVISPQGLLVCPARLTIKPSRQLNSALTVPRHVEESQIFDA